ncbi:fimbria/pilus outer membrane usher protein [Neisseria sp. CCUG12390]|uniref:fimbria/pilus outer membrane usher protein n=1 Tax=Neisseria sp. CCUG12390 TaxID=3392035 RepID=UPI003A0FD649
MPRPDAAFPLKQIVVGVWLCLCTLQASAQQDAPAAAVHTAEKLTIYPQVTVNGSLSDGAYPFLQDGERLFVRLATLEAMGIKVPSENLKTARSTADAAADGGIGASVQTASETAESEAAPEAAADGKNVSEAAGQGVSDGLNTPSENPSDPTSEPLTEAQTKPQTGAVPEGKPHDASAEQAGKPSEPESGSGKPPVQTDDTADKTWFELSAIPRLEVRYNAAEQTLALTAPLEWLDRPVTRIGGDQDEAYAVARPGFAGVLNYDYNHTRSSDGSSQGILAEARLATPFGYLSHNHIWNENRSSAGGGRSDTSRLDTYWRSVWAEKGLAFTAGDLTTGGIGGSGGSRLGGIKLERTYSVQPWRNTAPLRTFLGETTLPGTVDLYLNGVKQYSREVSAGGYEIILPPSVSGSGMAQVVATDVLGRTVVVDMPLYGGSGLLAKGLSEWSLEAGYLRKDYGIKDFSYDKQLVGSGTLCYGISSFLTAQVHAEGGGGYRKFGAAATSVLGSLGQLDLSHTQSYFKGHSGGSSSAFFSTSRRRWSFGTGFSVSDDRYTGMGVILSPADYAPENRKNRTASVSASWNGNLAGSFNASYVYSRSGSDKADKIGTLGWNRNFGNRVSAGISASNNFNGSKERSIYGSLSFSFDKGYSFNVGGRRDNLGSNAYNLSLNKSGSGLNSPSWGIGWERETDDDRSSGRLNGHLSVNTQYGDLRGGVYGTGGQTNYNAGWRGGLVLMKGGLFATRHVHDSFAVVDTRIGGVPVTLFDNRIGKTDRRGLMLVPNLSAYRKNNIGIDITDLPYDMKAERAKAQAVPSEKSGIAVEFNISRMRAVSLTLKAPDGGFIESGSMIQADNGQPAAVVGFDGQTFIENIGEGRNRYTVNRADGGGTCSFEIEYREPSSDGLPDLGEVVCGG